MKSYTKLLMSSTHSGVTMGTCTSTLSLLIEPLSQMIMLSSPQPYVGLKVSIYSQRLDSSNNSTHVVGTTSRTSLLGSTVRQRTRTSIVCSQRGCSDN